MAIFYIIKKESSWRKNPNRHCERSVAIQGELAECLDCRALRARNDDDVGSDGVRSDDVGP